MYARMAFAEAVAEAHRNAEKGLGYAVRNEQGQFFCGFAQKDGALAFEGYRQRTSGEGAQSAYSKENPVFLDLEEMKDLQIGAAVFGMIYQVNTSHGLPDKLAESCQRVVVRKDLTHKPNPNLKAGLWDYPISKSGLASAQACAQGQDDGYIGFFYAFKKGFRKAFGIGSP